MLAGNLVAVYLLASFCLAQAYPALLPYIYNPSKRSDSVFPEIEDDVDELDQLRVSSKRQPDGSSTTTTTTNESVEEVPSVPNPNILPDLERQLEVATPLISTTTTTSTSATTTTGTSKEEGERSQLEEPKTANKPTVVAEPTVHSKTAQSLLRNPNGQYSSFDMAQYVFWTGDETGVARAVEELIKENLITRENALKFLRDIRLGIEFLQRSYDNRIFPEELRQNHLKRNSPPSTAATTTTSTTSTTTTSTTTTEKPFPDVHESDISPDVNAMPVPVSVPVPVSLKQLDSLSFWNKLKQMDNDAQQDLTDYDEGRAKIVEYLYNEYSLEEILYKLAKVMFSQSLAHGSDEAQMELQKLTEFLEHEGNLGVIPVDLQKKVLRVLLTALSDTLSEHPELLPAARVNLANPYYRLPMQTPSQ
ncbi:uncharacterized protein Dwil_GK13351, isoform B [Drosophila willistoni]|uniref:Uncharacterized protein, isoform B n=1 Tax=Drosophila willistoni TaxID=7260 RepID=A0A0Q9WVZ7_DROWI|nr:probable basic-leucine zipper transcription factor N isoform X3 [Drosophila willistoni]KRF99956.1 uncharacterized protein Dwil_GK13351, isoform B [Drosophila willistoni]